MHEHFDAEDNFTGSTVITRQAEWDDESRELAMADSYLDAKACPGCGNDLEVSLQPGHSWDVDEDTVCYACAALTTVRRDSQKDHEKESPVKGKPMFLDGRIHTVRLFDDSPKIGD